MRASHSIYRGESASMQYQCPMDASWSLPWPVWQQLPFEAMQQQPIIIGVVRVMRRMNHLQ